MRTRSWIVIATAAALALAIVLTLPSLTFAAGPSSMVGRGPGGGMGGRMGGPQQSLVAVAAQVLGVQQADLVAELQAGKTIADVAGDKAGAIVDAFVKPRADRLAAMVAAGRITQAQADQQLATMRANVTARLSQPWAPQGAGFVDADGDGVCDHAGTGPRAGAGQGGGRMGGR